MPAPKAKPKSKTIKPTKTVQKGLVTFRFKFNKLGALALAAVLSVAGAVYVFSSQAATVHTYGVGLPTEHHGGQAVNVHVYWRTASGAFYFAGLRTLWYSNYNASPGTYMWYGPYATVDVPSGAHGITACWWYMTYGTTAVFDVSQYAGQLVKAYQPNLAATPGLLHDGSAYKEVVPFCQNVGLAVGSHAKVELRARPTNTTNSDLWIYKTTWQIY